MPGTLEFPPVAKKQPKPEPSMPTQSSTRIDREVLRKANIIARMQGVSLYDLIDSLLRPPVEATFKSLIRSDSQQDK